MFQALNNIKFTKTLDKDKFRFTKHTYRLIYDISEYNLENSQTENKVNIKEMYSEDDLIILLKDDGIIFVIKYAYNGRVKNILQIPYYTRTDLQAKSISINRIRKSLLIVHLNKTSSITELKCKSIDFSILHDCLRGGIELKESHFQCLFFTENLSSPAFIEFDETNKVIITRNSLSTFKIWSMKDYDIIFEINDRRIEEIRTSDEVFITIKACSSLERLILSVHDIKNGKNVINYEIELLHGVDLEILEVFDTALLVKQSYNLPLLFNLVTQETHVINNNELDEKSLFMHISNTQSFIVLNRNYLIFYSNKGEELRRITNSSVYSILPQYVSITVDKEFLILYWETKKSKGNNNFNKTPQIKAISSIDKKGSSFHKRIMFSPSISNITHKSEYEEQLSDLYFFQSTHSNKKDTQTCQMNSNVPFKGEFEMVNLKQDIMKTRFNLIQDTDLGETIGYFTFDCSSMKLFFVTNSGKIYDSSL